MHRYCGYPTPPSTGGESPASGHSILSSPSFSSDNSSSPVPQNVFFPASNETPRLDFILEQGYTNTQLASNTMNSTPSHSATSPYLKIVEEPIDKFRFRYKSEMTGTHGSLNGENSDRTRKMTYPTVQLHNYEGNATIRCSIWQINHEDNNCMPHAHRLVKRRNHRDETDDPHEELVNKETSYLATFDSMGIIHTAKKNIASELMKKKIKLILEDVARSEKRKKLNKTEEMKIKKLVEDESKSINLNVVCLRFDCFIVADGIYWPLCPPVFSHAINNLKSALTGELKIVRMDHCTSPAIGNREIFLFVERITKKNIKVRFFELDDDDNVVWEDYGKFNELDVHHQYAIALRTPPYRDINMTNNVNVFMELVRPSDNERSEPREFKYIPMPEHYRIGSKRARPNNYDCNDYDTFPSINGFLPTIIQNTSSDFDMKKFSDNMDSKELDDLFKSIKNDYQPTLPELGNSLISMDYPANLNLSHQNSSSGVKSKMYQSREKDVKRIFEEFSEFLKTKPNCQEIKSMLHHHLSTNFIDAKERLNAFHLAVLMYDEKMINFFISLITSTDSYEFLNVTSLSGTVLHLAIMCKNMELVKLLVSKYKVDISKKDDNENTALHIAAKVDTRGSMLSALLEAENVEGVINCSNKDGDTALHLAVKKGNQICTMKLCKSGANVDLRHPKNGYTALRFAVENEDAQMTRLLLYDIKVNPKVRDFLEIDPLQAVLHTQTTLELKEIVQIYMTENNISYDEIRVKQEIEEDSSEEDVIIRDKVKAEPLPLTEDVQELYSSVTHFTDECLDEISKLLDDSGKWQELAALFDIEHLFRMEIFDAHKSRSKQLLNYVVASNVGNIKEIRDFLESLDQLQVVLLMDKMVYRIHQESNNR